MPFVLDASAALAIGLSEISQSAADLLIDRITQDRAVLPSLFPLEVANALEMARRRGRVTGAWADAFLAQLGRMAIMTRPPHSFQAMTALRVFSERHGLTLYDGAYLDLALRERLEIVTLDAAITRAAATIGVTATHP